MRGAAPTPGGNGGKRVPAPQRLTPAPPAEADVAMLAWAGGPLEQAAHGLFATTLVLAPPDPGRPARPRRRRRALWQAPLGWAVAEAARRAAFHVAWLCTYPEEARVMLRALVDLAPRCAEAERLEMEVPAVDWLRRRPGAGRLGIAPDSGLRPGALAPPP